MNRTALPIRNERIDDPELLALRRRNNLRIATVWVICGFCCMGAIAIAIAVFCQ